MKNDLIINQIITIPEHEIDITTSRAGGPGGQHVNKTNTKITLTWNPKTSSALTEEQKERIITKLSNQLSTEGALVIHNATTRSQLQNKQQAFAALSKKIREALHIPKKRMQTKITTHIKEKRLKKKKERSDIKKLRKKIID